MASLESINYIPRRPEVSNGCVQWVETCRRTAFRLPQIIWENNTPWAEANLWALDLGANSRRDYKTVLSCMSNLLDYAKWLEAEGVDWWHFPERESERCLTRYRGALVHARSAGELSPSTTSHRMATVIRYYRWLQATRLLSTDSPMWQEQMVGIKLTNSFGLEHTLRVATTDLAIPNRKVGGAIQLEDGVLPVSLTNMREILELAAAEGTEEIALMLQVGFFSGLRLGSITDLKVRTLENSTTDPAVGWHRLAVGPAARPSVATKFSVSGMVPIPRNLLEILQQYATSTRRLKRQTIAARENRGLLFLTRYGNPYSGDQSRAVNVEMSRLRRVGQAAGIDVFSEFHFHRTRATFATELMRVALRFLSVGDAIHMVREACLHKEAATTLKYVKFIETSKAMAEAADAFTEAFMGLARGA